MEESMEISEPAQEPSAEVQRQRLDADIVCVGFGPAMAGFLTGALKATPQPRRHARGGKRGHARHAPASPLL